jgi:hypothetical protein
VEFKSTRHRYRSKDPRIKKSIGRTVDDIIAYLVWDLLENKYLVGERVVIDGKPIVDGKVFKIEFYVAEKMLKLTTISIDHSNTMSFL